MSKEAHDLEVTRAGHTDFVWTDPWDTVSVYVEKRLCRKRWRVVVAIGGERYSFPWVAHRSEAQEEYQIVAENVDRWLLGGRSQVLHLELWRKIS